MELIGTKTVDGRYIISNHHFNISMSFSGASIDVLGSYGVNHADVLKVDGDTFIGIFGLEEVCDVETNAMYCKLFNSKGVSDGI